jgi:hypothetical protein
MARKEGKKATKRKEVQFLLRLLVTGACCSGRALVFMCAQIWQAITRQGSELLYFLYFGSSGVHVATLCTSSL